MPPRNSSARADAAAVQALTSFSTKFIQAASSYFPGVPVTWTAGRGAGAVERIGAAACGVLALGNDLDGVDGAAAAGRPYDIITD